MRHTRHSVRVFFDKLRSRYACPSHPTIVLPSRIGQSLACFASLVARPNCRLLTAHNGTHRLENPGHDAIESALACRRARAVRVHTFLHSFLAIAIVVTTCVIAEEPPEKPLRNDTKSEVAATVDGVPIFVADVDLRVRQILGDRKTTPEALLLIKAKTLEELIRQQKVLVQLQRRGEACTPQELERELQRLQKELARQEKTLDDYCRSLKIPRASFHRMVQWQLSWKRCRDKYLTDENLQRHFERHRHEFDGTTRRIAQILLKGNGDANRAKLVEQAAKIRSEITSGTITFADAARKYSQAPSAADGGDLGWIQRHAPMPEFLSRVAYELEVNEISQPITSPYGVHLLRCIEIKPGQKKWSDVRAALRKAVAEYLFDWLADRPEPKHDVRYSENVPHFRPGTHDLVTPETDTSQEPQE